MTQVQINKSGKPGEKESAELELEALIPPSVQNALDGLSEAETKVKTVKAKKVQPGSCCFRY